MLDLKSCELGLKATVGVALFVKLVSELVVALLKCDLGGLKGCDGLILSVVPLLASSKIGVSGCK